MRTIIIFSAALFAAAALTAGGGARRATDRRVTMSNHRCIVTAIRVTGGALLAAALVAFAAQAATLGTSRWEQYTNTRYGVMIDYPADLFAIQPPPPDNAGRDFDAPDAKARFHVYSHANALDLARDELAAEDVLDLGDAAAKKESGPDWYQIVAVKDDDTILRRVLLSEGGAKSTVSKSAIR